jgi:hypothetical protein
MKEILTLKNSTTTAKKGHPLKTLKRWVMKMGLMNMKPA